MASPPPSTQFRKQDYPSTGLGTQDALERFFNQLNGFLSAARSALDAALTFRENSLAEVKTVTLTTPGSGTGVLSCFPLSVSTTVASPVGVVCINARDTGAGAPVPSLGAASWVKTAQGVQVTNLPGLSLGRTYSLTLLIIGG